MAFTYSILDSFSIAFLMILFVSTREKSSRLTETRCFRSIVIMTSAALMCDMIGWQLDGHPGAGSRSLLWCANIACYVLSGATALAWLYYTALKMNCLGRIKKSGWLLIAIPCILLAVTSLITPWTHWLFHLDANNIYERGPLYAMHTAVPFGYILAAAIWSLHQSGRERLHQQRMEYLYLSSFIIFPLIGGVIQLAVYGVSLAWPCTALSLMLVYVSMQNQKISLDALTGLNNRVQFDKHLFNCFERTDSDLSFALFMLDIDDFKRINDHLGHTAGDAALIDAANIHKRSLAGSSAFLARYGGDEFAVILYYSDTKQIDALLNKITSEARKHSFSSPAPYSLVFSIGYASFDKRRYTNYQDMITAADAKMYQVKRLHKAGHAEGADP